MKRSIVLIFTILLCGSRLHAQEKITRYIHQVDYIGYSQDLFHAINRHIYLLAYQGKIAGYGDAEMTHAMELPVLRKRGEICERIVGEEVKTGENSISKDIVSCYDPDMNKFYLVFDKRINQKPDFRKNVATALYYDSAGHKALLYYVKFPEFLDKLNADESGFLMDYISQTNIMNNMQSDMVIDSANISAYALSMYSKALKTLMIAANTGHIKIYKSDSLVREMSTAEFQSWKGMFSKNDQKLDSDAIMGFIISEEPVKSGDGILLKKSALGVWAYLILNGVLMPEAPVFYTPYLEARALFAGQDNSSTGIALEYLNNVVQYQLIHRLSDDYRH
jgi:uncharacterized protein Smg (DUF494 family)